MSDSQAYPGNVSTIDAQGEFNRMRTVFDSLLDGVSTAIPVKVVAVRGTRVDVQPMVNQLDGAGQAVPHGTVNNLPVWRYGGATSAIIVVPQVGDKGLAVFCHSDISSVKANSDTANPGSYRKFDYADGVYLGGLFNDDAQQTITVSGEGVVIDAPIVRTTGNLSVGTGATGSLTDAIGQVVTVVDGIIVGIE